MGGKNQYVKNISEKFTTVLQEAVEALTSDVEAYTEFLDDWQHILAESIANNAIGDDEYIHYEKADELASQIERSALRVIEEATRIDTQDIV